MMLVCVQEINEHYLTSNSATMETRPVWPGPHQRFIRLANQEDT